MHGFDPWSGNKDHTCCMAPDHPERKKKQLKENLTLIIPEFSLQSYSLNVFSEQQKGLWEIDGETVETVSDFIFLGSKIIVDGDCSHEITRCLLLRRKAMTNLDSILKSRDITLLSKVLLVKFMVFPVVTYGYES